MKKIIFILIMIIFISNVYCDEKQDISTILNTNILNDDLYAQNELITNKTNKTQLAIKDTVSISPILKRPNSCFTFALDTVVMPGIKIGFGSIKYDSTSTKEKYVMIHANTIMAIHTLGILGKVNTFKFPQRKGFYTSYTIGIDFVVSTPLPLDPGGSSGSSETQNYLFPYFSFGIGYSFQTGNSSYFRISGDLGLKLVIANITLSYVF